MFKWFWTIFTLGAPGSGAGSTFLSSQCSLSVDLVVKLGGISGTVGSYSSVICTSTSLSRICIVRVFPLKKLRSTCQNNWETFVCRYYSQLPQKVWCCWQVKRELCRGKHATLLDSVRDFIYLYTLYGDTNYISLHLLSILFYFILLALPWRIQKKKNKQTKKQKHCTYANTSNKNVSNIRAGTPQQLKPWKPITADTARHYSYFIIFY